MAERTTLLITGGASGIGQATARRMARSGAHVIVADRDADGAASIVDEIKREGGSAAMVVVDVTQRAAVKEMVGQAQREGVAIDALFNNAGISRKNLVEQIPEDEWDLMLTTHVKSTFLCCQAVLPQMCDRRAGVILNMSSDYAVKGMVRGAAYAAAKTAIFSLTKSLALEFATYGIRVNALGPGPIDTPLLRAGRTGEEWTAAAAERAELVPMGRLGRPDEVASVVEFLLSARAAYMTGQIVHPNGGTISW